CDAEDISTDEDGFVTIIADPSEANKISNALESCGKELEFEEEGTNLIAATYQKLDKESEEKFNRMIMMLEELDDFQQVYHNAILSE
ncbi:MAG: YebC/PmpR family DNA-binding transcriptional regulator, partial [Anaeroplasmataceae bacterium]